jgi:hypothetical protein
MFQAIHEATSVGLFREIQHAWIIAYETDRSFEVQQWIGTGCVQAST